MKERSYDSYVNILKEELILALGCTEPACLALAGAKAREVLGDIPDYVVIKLNGALFKNANSVNIPNSGGLKGIPAAVILGIVAGDSTAGLEVLAKIDKLAIEKVRQLLSNPEYYSVSLLEPSAMLHVILEATLGSQHVFVEIQGQHTNIVRVVLNDKVLLDRKATSESTLTQSEERSCLNIRDILKFANQASLDDVESILTRQIEYNFCIANEGLKGDYGAGIGKKLISGFGSNVQNRARAIAAAGSDARMGGCALPVVINSGSGNQGITVSLPIVVYAEHYQIPHEKMLRALLVANLIAIHIKTNIGRLSAYCGVVSAACGSGAGITYMFDGSYEQVVKTINNTLGNVSGIICDGAKASCAAKIASAVDAAILGHTLAMEDVSFQAGDGIIKSDVEQTIAGVGLIAKNGMKTTDEVILKVVLKK